VAFFGLFGGKRRTRRTQTSAQPPARPRRFGQASRRYLERVADLEDVQRRRRAGARSGGRARRAEPGDTTVELDPHEVEREIAKRRREREREQRAEARMIGKAAKARDRAIAAYMSNGLSRAEAEDMVDREPDWSTYDFNPRGVRRSHQLAARTNRRRRNPGLSALAAEIAKDVVKGGMIAAAQEEAKEWRNRWHARRGRSPSGKRQTKITITRERNPARREPNHADPKLREMSERFHGRPDQILHLDEDQRRPPPKHVVLIGQERATVYRPPRGSERGGADWEHESGDRGMFQRNVGGRRLVVADEHGRVYLLQGSSSMRFDPDRGLVG
jgi:hypothetical protein